MNTEQCKGCGYYRTSSGAVGDIHFCHHLLDTGKRRQVGENEICLSRAEKGKRACRPFQVPTAQS